MERWVWALVVALGCGDDVAGTPGEGTTTGSSSGDPTESPTGSETTTGPDTTGAQTDSGTTSGSSETTDSGTTESTGSTTSAGSDSSSESSDGSTTSCVPDSCDGLGCGLHLECGDIIDCDVCGSADGLRVNRLVADASRNRFYTSVASADPDYADTIAVIDAASFEIVDLIELDTEANSLALSDDDSTLWAGLDANNSILEIDLSGEIPTPGSEHGLPDAGTTAGDMVVLPGETTSVAISVVDNGYEGAIVLDDGVVRPNELSGFDGPSRLTGGPNGWLFGFNDEHTGFEFYAVEVNNAGLAETSFDGMMYGFDIDLVYADDRVYTGDGRVIDVEDPENPRVEATLTGAGVVLPRTDVPRIHMLTFPQGVLESGISLRNFDAETFVQLDVVDMPALDDSDYYDLATTDGQTLAVIEEDFPGRLHLFANPFPDPEEPGMPCVPLTCDPPAVCGVHDDGCGDVLDCEACGDAETLLEPVHIIGDAGRNRIYVSLWGDAPHFANHIAMVDPGTGEVVDTFYVGSNPDELAMSDDGTVLWVATDGNMSIRRIDLTTDPPTPGVSHRLPTDVDFDDEPHAAGPFVVLPGTTDSLAVPLRRFHVTPATDGIAVLDSGVPRPNIETYPTPALVVGGSGTSLFGFTGPNTSSPRLYGLEVDAGGVTASELPTPTEAFGVAATYADGRVFLTDGRVVDVSDPDDPWPVAALNGEGPTAILPADQSVAVLSADDTPLMLRRIDPDEFTVLEAHAVAGLDPTDVRELVTTSGAQFAFIAENFGAADSFHLVDSPFDVPVPPPVTTPLPRVHHVITDPGRSRYYATVWGDAPFLGNRVVSLDAAGSVVESWFAGSNPSALALSADGDTLWVALDGSIEVAAFDLSVSPPAETTRYRIPLVPLFDDFRRASSIVPVGGTTDGLAVATSGDLTEVDDLGDAEADHPHRGLDLRPALELVPDLFPRGDRPRDGIGPREDDEDGVAREVDHRPAPPADRVQRRPERGVDHLGDLFRAFPPLLLEPLRQRREPRDVREEQCRREPLDVGRLREPLAARQRPHEVGGKECRVAQKPSPSLTPRPSIGARSRSVAVCCPVTTPSVATVCSSLNPRGRPRERPTFESQRPPPTKLLSPTLQASAGLGTGHDRAPTPTNQRLQPPVANPKAQQRAAARGPRSPCGFRVVSPRSAR